MLKELRQLITHEWYITAHKLRRNIKFPVMTGATASLKSNFRRISKNLLMLVDVGIAYEFVCINCQYDFVIHFSPLNYSYSYRVYAQRLAGPVCWNNSNDAFAFAVDSNPTPVG